MMTSEEEMGIAAKFLRSLILDWRRSLLYAATYEQNQRSYMDDNKAKAMADAAIKAFDEAFPK